MDAPDARRLARIEGALNPQVTVLMAVHNGGAFLDRAIDSVLSQTFRDFEFLIVDDSSTDGTAERLAALTDSRVCVHRNDLNRGLTASLNAGLRAARGTWIARQDADDVSHPDRLRTQVDYLRSHDDIAVLGTQARIVNAAGRRVAESLWPKCTSGLAIRWQLLFDTPFVHSSVMFRASIVRDQLGGYDERFRSSQDFELWSRAARRGHALRNLDRALIDFRTHEASVSAGYRYQPASLGQVGALLRDNFIAELGAGALPDGWPDMWVRISNPDAFPDSSREAGAVVRAIEQIHRAFRERHPDAARDPEIRRNTAAMLVRVANAGARGGRVTSVRAVATAAHFDAAVAAAAVPRSAARLIIGSMRRLRGSAARIPVNVAKAIYRATPVPGLRRLYFAAFCRLVRERKVIASIGGCTYELDLGEMIDVALYLDQYERDVAAALQRYCRPGMTVLDIGANIGAHTLPIGRLVTARGAVYAFEPMDFAFRKLSRNVSLNDAPHIHPVNAALGEAGAAALVLNYRSSWRTTGGRADHAAAADVIRLDDWCRAHAVDDVGLIKIDVDGNEFAAFSGGIDLLRRCRPLIVMEAVWPHFASDDRNPFLLLQRLGYRFFDAHSETEFPTVHALAQRFPRGDHAMTTSMNVIARPSATGV